MRIVSVLPSATEIVCALGHGSELVARSSECDYPPEVVRLPAVMRPRTWDGDRPSRDIDSRVRRARAEGESLYELDVDLLRTLRPDLLLTQDLCGVCSVTEQEVSAACALAGVRPKVISLTPTNLAEVLDTIVTVGEALGDPGESETLVTSLRSRTRTQSPTGRSVAVVEWLDPPILAGLWTPDLILAAGGVPIGPRPSQPGIRTTWPELARLGPELLVISPCSFSVGRTRQELEDPKVRAAVASVEAPLGTILADEAYFSRPGPRLAAGAELIRTLLSGEVPGGPRSVESFSSRNARMTA